MDQHEVTRTALADHAGVRLAEELSSAPRRRRQGLPRLQPGLHELLHLPGELVRPRGAAAEVRPRRDRHAGPVGDADAVDRPFAARLHLRAPLVRREARDRRRPPERPPRGQDAQRGHEVDAVGGHDRGRRLVQLKAVLQGVDSRLRARPGTRRVSAVGRHPSPAGVDGIDDAAQLTGGPGAHSRVRPVEVELDQVGSIVELADRRREQLVRIVGLHGQGREEPLRHHPGPGRADVRIAGAAPPAVADPDGHGAGTVPVAGIRSGHGADVARPADPRPRQEPGVGLRVLEEVLGGVRGPIDPARAARHRQVAVGVNQAGDDRRTGGVDDLQAAGGRHRPLVVGRANPCDAPVLDQDRHAQSEAVTPAVGEGAVAIERAHRAGSGGRQSVGRRIRNGVGRVACFGRGIRDGISRGVDDVRSAGLSGDCRGHRLGRPGLRLDEAALDRDPPRPVSGGPGRARGPRGDAGR